MRFLFFLMVLVSFNSYAQDGTFEEFAQDLSEVSDQKILEKLLKQSLELEETIFSNPNKVKYDLEPDRVWRFMFARTLGWEEQIGFGEEDLGGNLTSDFIKVFTGKEITDMFGLKGKPAVEDLAVNTQRSERRFHSTYVLRARNDRYAVVVKVHSYPNGDATSWYSEERYYFVID